MTAGTLVDAGPLVALLHREDHDHQLCVDTLRDIRGPLLTTWMPITEAMYLLDFSIMAQGALLEMIERGALQVLPLEVDDIPIVRSLMEKYKDLPMDFADATLVHVANRQRIREIFTLDRRDFSIYRLKRRQTFIIVPSG